MTTINLGQRVNIDQPIVYRDATLTRLFDVIVATVGLILLLPLFIVIGIAIKLADNGPILYRATRVGRDGQVFALYKFRTMRVAADREGPGITVNGDPRITAIGAWLRKTKIDELPQLFNVLRGDMSLVGPRPENAHYVAMYTPSQRRVLTVRPGITSAASIYYCQESSLLTGKDWERMYCDQIMPDKLQIDLEYLARRTFWTDLGLIIRTAIAIAM